jgi:WD40 repeat protein
MHAQLDGGRIRQHTLSIVAMLVAVISTSFAAQERPVRRMQIPALITALAFAPDGETLVAWDPAGWSRWDAASGRQREREAVIAKACARASVLPRSDDGRVVAAQCRDRLLFFEVATGRTLGERRLEEKQTAAVYTASLNGKTTALVMAGATDTVHLGSLASGTDTAVKVGTEIEQLTLDSDGARLTVGSWRGVEIRDAPGGTLRRRLEGQASHAMSADGRTVAVIGGPGARLFDGETGEAIRTLEGRVSHVRFSPDGRLLAGWTNQRVIVWDAATGAQRLVLTSDEFSGAAISPDGRQLATLSLERRGEGTSSLIAVWRLP